MNALVAARTAEQELGELYGRYKTLVLAATAALMLDRPVADVAHETARLVEDCVRASADAIRFEDQFAACVTAARELERLFEIGGDESRAAAHLDVVRASHRTLRREVWNVLPCEYVPCCASAHTHAHR